MIPLATVAFRFLVSHDRHNFGPQTLWMASQKFLRASLWIRLCAGGMLSTSNTCTNLASEPVLFPIRSVHWTQSRPDGRSAATAAAAVSSDAACTHPLSLYPSKTSSFCTTVLTNHCHCSATNFNIRWWDSSPASPSLYSKRLNHAQTCNGDQTIRSTLKRVRIELWNRHSR